ncbi:hypothetical protein [Pseudomonas amygdali]|uniref:hypothetical protein n=1 Tax=Pseudomonas amygdali TaxID=47877 RepID=UPI0005C962BB|nr:hypothetical protein [Pseudomonas amygdali]KWS80243.1 hypothetical protein AL051_03365 [Pseudomonas amygdali pv. dendropanacis]
MSDYHGKRLPPFSDDKEFEKFSLDLWVAQNPRCKATLNGRNGQTQNGVDVVIRIRGQVIGIQCKAVASLTQGAFDEEVRRAEGYRPKLNELIIVTCAPHNAALVSHAESLTLQHQQTGVFSVSYHGWQDLLRILEDYPAVSKKHFSNFYLEAGAAAQMPVVFRLPVDDELNIPMSDEELALFCSDASWALKQGGGVALAVEQSGEQRLLEMIAAIEAASELDISARTSRANLRDILAAGAPKLRKLEAAVRLLLTDDVLRSPWLLGGSWAETADTLRRLVPLVIKGSQSKPNGLTLKIRHEARSALLGYIDLEEADAKTFMARCPMFTPTLFFGAVVDLGPELQLKYALPAGLSAIVNYSAAHGVPISALQQDGTVSIFCWGLYPA